VEKIFVFLATGILLTPTKESFGRQFLGFSNDPERNRSPVILFPVQGVAVDRESLDLGNDLVLDDPALGQCSHGRPWNLCEIAECQAIGRLIQEQRKEQRKDERDWRDYEFVEKRRGQRSEYDIALEQNDNQRVITDDYENLAAFNVTYLPDDQTQPDARKLLRNIFRDPITIQAAVQFKAVTPRQGQVLKGYLESDQKLSLNKRWNAIGKKIRFSGRTVEREFRAIVEKFLKTKPKKAGEGYSTVIEVVHIRGERQLRYYRNHSVRFGEWNRKWSELITDKKVIRELDRERVPMTRFNKTPILSSRVNWLFGELIRVFANQVPEPERVPPEGISAADWEYNVRRARHILERKHAEPWTTLEVYYALGRGARVCGACRTFLIRGFRINGRRITRARQFCDEACKMKAERRKKNSTRINQF